MIARARLGCIAAPYGARDGSVAYPDVLYHQYWYVFILHPPRPQGDGRLDETLTLLMRFRAIATSIFYEQERKGSGVCAFAEDLESRRLRSNVLGREVRAPFYTLTPPYPMFTLKPQRMWVVERLRDERLKVDENGD